MRGIVNVLASQGFGQYYNAINALAVALFPPLYFFTFLYYTDVGSTFTVLLAYLLTLHHNHLLAAVISVMAVLFRQTNIVWVAFLGLLTVKKVVEKLSGKGLQRVNKNSLKYVEVGKFSKRLLRNLNSTRGNICFAFQEFVKSSLNILANRKNPGRGALIRELTTRCGGYVAVGLGFLGFVLWNQGVALGDRDAHSVTVHLPQVLYCMAFTLVFACPYLVSSDHIRHFVRVVMNHKLIIVILSVVMVVTIALNTVVHPYLLADNRHYTFYIWRWFLGRHPLAKFLLVPLYIYAAWSVFSSLLRSRGLLWTVSFYICVVANLVPQGLLEPRYFILPYIIFRLNLATSLKVKALIIEIFIYFFINIYSLNLFLMHPFVMPDADVLQRFMW